jgi:hypothetical protein
MEDVERGEPLGGSSPPLGMVSGRGVGAALFEYLPELYSAALFLEKVDDSFHLSGCDFLIGPEGLCLPWHIDR